MKWGGTGGHETIYEMGGHMPLVPPPVPTPMIYTITYLICDVCYICVCRGSTPLPFVQPLNISVQFNVSNCQHQSTWHHDHNLK